MTNQERYEGKTQKELMDIAIDDNLCEICNRMIDKNLSPNNPVCEGSWCDEALVYWLEEELNDE